MLEIGDGSSKWDVIKAYYACYHALYAVLMKCGIKCEIHDCSIELMKNIGSFSKEDYSLLIELKENRIQVQYYLKKKTLSNLNQVKRLILKCQEIAENIDLTGLRDALKNGKK